MDGVTPVLSLYTKVCKDYIKLVITDRYINTIMAVDDDLDYYHHFARISYIIPDLTIYLRTPNEAYRYSEGR